jgi:hypothetical protein
MPSKNKIVKKTSKLIPQKRLVSKVNFKDSKTVLENISIGIIVFDFDNITNGIFILNALQVFSLILIQSFLVFLVAPDTFVLS